MTVSKQNFLFLQHSKLRRRQKKSQCSTQKFRNSCPDQRHDQQTFTAQYAQSSFCRDVSDWIHSLLKRTPLAKYFKHIYVILVFFVSVRINPSSGHRSIQLLVLGDQLLLVFGLVMCVVAIVMDMVNRGRILRIVQRFEAFDKEVNSEL